MPDKNTPWTPDEAFWNEAWADMNARLEAKRRRRFLLPWVVGILLLAGGGALVHYLWEAPAVPVQAVVDRPPAAAPGNTRVASVPAMVGDSGERSATPTRRWSPAEAPPPAAEDAPVAVRADRSPDPGRGEFRVAPLASAAIEPLPLGLQFIFPEVVAAEDTSSTFSTRSPRIRYAAGIGVNGYARSLLPGAYADLVASYSAGKWFVPVGLRIDYSRRESRLNQEADILATADFNQVGNSITGGQFALADLSKAHSRGRSSLYTLQLRAGVGRRVGTRWSVAGGAAATYLLAGHTPLIYRTATGNTAYYAVDNEKLDRAVGQADARNAGSGGAELITRLNRWGLSSWLQANYRMSPRFDLQLGLTYQASSLYRPDALRVDRLRLESGAVLKF